MTGHFCKMDLEPQSSFALCTPTSVHNIGTRRVYLTACLMWPKKSHLRKVADHGRESRSEVGEESE